MKTAQKYPIIVPRTFGGARIPHCYGLSFMADSDLCVACPVNARCREVLLEVDSRSLSERLQGLLIAAEVQTDTDIASLYDSLYQLHFGRKAYRRDTPRNRAMFNRLEVFLAKESLDAETYITANMVRLKEWVNTARYGFQPNMLLGENAVGRYNAYVRASNRRYLRATADASNHRTDLGHLRCDLFLSEKSVATLFVASSQVGEPCEWLSVAKKAETCEAWILLQVGRDKGGDAYYALMNKFGLSVLEREKQIATFGAASALAESYQSGLSNRIGCRDGEFSWVVFAKLIARLYPTSPNHTAPQNLGSHWGGCIA